MNRNRIFGLVSAAALLMAGACSNDTIDPGLKPGQLTPNDGAGVYLAVDFKMPSQSGGTRSTTGEPGTNGTTSSSGTEIGSNEENNVTSALVILAATEAKEVGGVKVEEYGYIVAGEVRNNRISFLTEKDNKQYRAVAGIQKENLNTYYGLYWDDATQSYNVPPVYVFVFCNPTKQLLAMFESEENDAFGKSKWIEETCSVTQGDPNAPDYNVGIWGANSFLMNNVSLAKRLLPEKLLDWELFTSLDNPFHLSDTNNVGTVSVDNSAANVTNPGGSVLVERSVARFDFKDGSAGQNKDNDANTYDVIYLTDQNGNIDDKEPIVQVELQMMCLVNMSNKFYYLPRVSPNGQNDNFTLLGAEKPWTRNANGSYTGGNYVVGPYASVFAGESDLTSGFSNYMNYPFFDDNGSFSNATMDTNRWNVVKIEDVLNGNKDNYEGTEGQPVEKGSYRVWRYVTENLIPGNIQNQVNGITTGIVFKGRIEGTKTAENATFPAEYEEYWNKGYAQNLANCLNGKPFKFNGESHDGGLEGNPQNDPIIYYFAGRLYIGWRHIRQAAIQASVTENVSGELEINRSNSLYKAVFGDGPIPNGVSDGVTTDLVYVKPNGESVKIVDPRWTACKDNKDSDDYKNYLKSANYNWSQWSKEGREVGDDASNAAGDEVPTLLTNMREAVTGAGITILQSSTDETYGAGYYCYYYYWNRHNDNGINGSMGPMEFDVVRNNVYKLSVDKINRIGHPRIPENDPNGPTPETPDESDEIYIDVRVQIAPWVVRVNSIIF